VMVGLVAQPAVVALAVRVAVLTVHSHKRRQSMPRITIHARAPRTLGLAC
jgi:hypothetical protein